MKKGVLRNFAKFTGKNLCQSLFFNNVSGLRAATVLKMRLGHRRFPVNFVKFLRAPFLQNTSVLLLLIFRRLIFDQELQKICPPENVKGLEFTKLILKFDKMFLTMLNIMTLNIKTLEKLVLKN